MRIFVPSLSILLIGLLFQSCYQTVKFEQPQPAGYPDLNKIPDRLIGQYQADSAYLTITKNEIVTYVRAVDKIARKELDLDSNIVLTGDTLINLTKGLKEKVIVDGDSVMVTLNVGYDTLYHISNKYRLRKFKGYYFLNIKLEENAWVVCLLDPEGRKEIALKKLQSPGDLTLLKEITDVKETRADTLSKPEYSIDPSRKELKKLMHRGFTTHLIYRRVEKY